ncbi:membrane-associating domain-containing protein [Fimicolochytrium jonesii]|uniref:membrane-associating domain-containing protein n=1 Tax=Fimicolochytrium jonesii TaxID=1396493 RepID=UPI0022FE0475|nr:membrane-associating domain-containing protein [Fimicolochytrium jonesii]KAI8818203.1 membrane-associating domain-containing protein [Fimicolochytrium jonesii]
MADFNNHPTAGPGLPTPATSGVTHGGGYSSEPASLLTSLRTPSTLLRILEWFLSLIAFSTAASYGDITSASRFIIFTGVLAWLLSSLFLYAAILRPARLVGTRAYHYGECAVSGIWTLFWFCGSVAFAAEGCAVGGQCGERGASIAFGFFSLFSWAASTWFAYHELRQS